MDIVLGVDGGSTKTVALAADLDGRILGIGRGGSSNWERTGFEPAVKVIRTCLDHALRMAGVMDGRIVFSHIGLSGLDWPSDLAMFHQALSPLLQPGGLVLENDAYLGIRACSPDGCGIGVGAGSGMCACIIPQEGSSFVYGGFTDLGGGMDIDDRTIQAVVRAEDGRGEPTALTGLLLEAVGCPDVRELIYSFCRKRLVISPTVLRPLLFTSAERGDRAAAGIVKGFAAELALCAVNLINRYQLAAEAITVVAAGSLFTSTGSLLFDTFQRLILQTAPFAQVIKADRQPVLGALRAALQACGHDSPLIQENLRQTMPGEEWFQTAAIIAGKGSNHVL